MEIIERQCSYCHNVWMVVTDGSIKDTLDMPKLFDLHIQFEELMVEHGIH